MLPMTKLFRIAFLGFSAVVLSGVANAAPDFPSSLDAGAIMNAERLNMSQKGLMFGGLEAMITPPEAVIIDEYNLLPQDLKVEGVILPEDETPKK